MSMILPYLYLGDAENAASLSDNITHVLNVSNDIPFSNPNLKTKRIPISDTERSRITPYFEETKAFIDDAKNSGGCVLVHCAAGISRSASIVIAYMMQSFNITMLDAIAFVRQYRQQIDPNFGFICQLASLEEKK